MNRGLLFCVCVWFALSPVGDASAQQTDQLRSALRPRPDRPTSNRTASGLGDAAQAAAQAQADFAGRVGRGNAFGGGTVVGGGNAFGRGGGRGGRGGYLPRYPDVYPSFFYGYTIGNPGFNTPNFHGGGFYPFPIYGGFGQGFGNGFGYEHGFPFRGGSVTRGLPGTPTPGSHFFGNPHASQYIPRF